MIERYQEIDMEKIWNEEGKLNYWLKVELSVIDAFLYFGIITKDVADKIHEKAKFDVNRVKEIEETTRHDVVAFITNLEENIGEDSQWIHFGMTSSDMLDTAFALQLKDAGELILNKIDFLLNTIKKRALEDKYTPMIGRSHGIHGEPITLGFVFASWYEELKRGKIRFQNGLKSISTGQISGAMGTFSFLDPEIENFVCESLGLSPEPISTQVIPRDRHLEYFYAMASLATSLERFAITIRHWQKTEMGEAEEFFKSGQKGSSAMPHKRNPISSENISGLARVVKSNLFAAIENVSLWHERDISHSSVERIIAPDTTTLIYYMLKRFANIVENLVIYPQKMMDNINLSKGLIYSQHLLLTLSEKGVQRQIAYKVVQKAAMNSFENKTAFLEELLKLDEITNWLTKDEIENCFSIEHHLRNIDTIFERVFD